MKIYLDNCCFNRPFDNQTQLRVSLESQAKLAIQAMIIEGKYNLIWSYILEYENANNPYELRRDSIIKWKDIAKINIAETEEILVTAENIMRLGIKTKDALHIACAAAAGADYFTL